MAEVGRGQERGKGVTGVPQRSQERALHHNHKYSMGPAKGSLACVQMGAPQKRSKLGSTGGASNG